MTDVIAYTFLVLLVVLCLWNPHHPGTDKDYW